MFLLVIQFPDWLSAEEMAALELALVLALGEKFGRWAFDIP